MKRNGSGKLGGSALTAALLISVSVHAAGFAWFYTRTPEVQIASSQSTSVSVVGSIEDLIAGSREVIEPIEQEQPKEIKPREIEQKEVTQEPREITPVKPVEVVEPVITPAKRIVQLIPQTVAPVIVPQIEGITQKTEISEVKPNEEAVPATPISVREVTASSEIDALKPVELTQAQSTQADLKIKAREKAESVQPEAAKPLQPKELETPVELKEVKPVEAETATRVEETKELEAKPVETNVAAVTVPIPRAAPPRPKQPNKAKPKKQKKPPQRAGNAQFNQKRGSDVTRKGTKTAKSGNNVAGSGDGAGNAAKDNYWGSVQRKLQRAAERKYPKREKKRKKTGTVRVTFTVQRSGTVTAATVSRSSGNKKLDQAALKAVRAASPFPAFPPSMRKNSISRTAPIVFRVK
ncbi:energy transducer TonB [Pseudovibrio sp. Tun.PSC04-5.I4]|uniref:cell envelope integrity protein TolA n=1 Tax=Pseudovibrio sp. Tun.PSC04-5.I4 TaxID=1798213 RepID=UPI0008853580|nr:energy transducer TonB [Pseudovibrio sp. Tun.PSC04-5.I4]SDR16936.1 protein TonB [Pseudovibrio sp. Tun.PSC04-5.I4]